MVTRPAVSQHASKRAGDFRSSSCKRISRKIPSESCHPLGQHISSLFHSLSHLTLEHYMGPGRCSGTPPFLPISCEDRQ